MREAGFQTKRNRTALWETNGPRELLLLQSQISWGKEGFRLILGNELFITGDSMANIFNFDNEFKLGIEAADIEHGKLVDMLNRTYELLKEGKREEARIYFSKTLSAYVHEHFSHEETFLKGIGFPELERHKLIHANFRKSVEELSLKIESADDVAFRQGLTDTFTWIINHIGKTDKKYANYYFEQRAK